VADARPSRRERVDHGNEIKDNAAPLGRLCSKRGAAFLSLSQGQSSSQIVVSRRYDRLLASRLFCGIYLLENRARTREVEASFVISRIFKLNWNAFVHIHR
jgi:hypothetical protein